MTSDRRYVPRPVRRGPALMLLAAALVITVGAAAWGAPALPQLPGLFSIAPAVATATPTRTPRFETATPTPAPIDLAIVLPTATVQPAAPAPIEAAVTVAPTVEPLTPHLVRVVERYGMDMSRRFIVIDLASQTMTVWDPGNPTRIMPVSTGDESRGYRTLAWYGLVGSYWGTFQASGVYADDGWYLFEDAGHILIHSTPYKLVNGEKVYEEMDALGAYPASKGCIRLMPEDADWFTAWDPEGVPIVILPKDEGLGIN